MLSVVRRQGGTGCLEPLGSLCVQGSIQRFTQDSPILADVWMAYAEDPQSRQDLLLTPYQSTLAVSTPGGTCHLDLLKLPHHGSDHNVSTEFPRQVTADHYVVSGTGEHGNPEIATFKMLSEARGRDEFTLYLTNEEPRLSAFFELEKGAGKRYKVVSRLGNALSIRADLGDALED